MSNKTSIVIAGAAVAALASIGLTVNAAASPGASPTKPTPSGAAASDVSAVQGDAAARLAPFFARTTDVQRACLAQQGLSAPARKLTQQERQDLSKAVTKAAEACSVKMPQQARLPGVFAFGFAKLTAEQQACVAKISLTRPIGRLTDPQRATLRSQLNDAAASCGVK